MFDIIVFMYFGIILAILLINIKQRPKNDKELF